MACVDGTVRVLEHIFEWVVDKGLFPLRTASVGTFHADLPILMRRAQTQILPHILGRPVLTQPLLSLQRANGLRYRPARSQPPHPHANLPPTWHRKHIFVHDMYIELFL